jgi:hypothetical protein
MTTEVSALTALAVILVCLVAGDRFPSSSMSMFAYGIADQDLVVLTTVDGGLRPAPRLLGLSTMNLTAVWLVEFEGRHTEAFVAWCRDRLCPEPEDPVLLIVRCRLSLAADGTVSCSASLLGTLANDGP